MRDRPDYSREDDLMRHGHARIAGVDEAGRGPIAGPVTAAAVILNPRAIPEGLNDSKKLTAKRREYLFDALMRMARVSVAHASVAEIETLNIRMATHLAMRRALLGLDVPPDRVLIDGRDVPDGLPCPGRAIIGGDGKSLSIAAASVIAKVTRDRVMVDLAQHHPGYGWEQNAGYPTKSHIAALNDYGVTQHHRRTYGPVHNMLSKGYS